MPIISITTTERDEAQDAAARVYFPHRLTVLHDPTTFSMSISAVNVGPVWAGLLNYSGDVHLETSDLETGYAVNIPIDAQLRTWTGHADVCATPAKAAVYRPDGRARLRGWTTRGQVFGVKWQREALEQTLGELLDRPVSAVIPFGPTLDLQHGAGLQWWRLTRALLALVEDPEGPLARPMITRPLAQSVMAAFLHVADHPYRDALCHVPARPRPASIREVVELIEARPEVPWTVTELARQVGVSSRGLQAGFARHIGTAPMTYLRQVRLQRAHQELFAADPAETTVTEVAMRWGFSHLSRFAAEYRRRYGQLPSETMHTTS